MDDLSRLRFDGAKLPIWLRIVVVLALALLAAGASLFAYRWYVRPVTLSIAGRVVRWRRSQNYIGAREQARRQQRPGAAEGG